MPKNSAQQNEMIPEVLVYGMINGELVANVAEQIKFYETCCSSIIARFNTPGGSIPDGIALYNCIKNAKVPVDVYIDGVAASMGAYAAFAGNKVFISKFGRVMIHEGRMGQGGTASEMRDNAELVESYDSNLVSMTMARTGLGEAQVKEKFFNGKDNWYTARQAVAAKLVDGIFDLEDVDVPEASDHTQVYAIMAEWGSKTSFNQPKNNVSMANKLSPEALAELGLTASATDADIVAAQQAKLSSLTAQMKKNTDDAKKEKVIAMLDVALNEGKIDAAGKTTLLAQFETNPEVLTTILATYKPYQSITDKLNTQSTQREGTPGVYAPHVEALMKKGWDVLDRTGELRALKTADLNAYHDLYKMKFGYLPNEKPKPVFVDRDIASRK